MALLALLVLQVVLFFAVTQRAFFALDDYFHFLLAQERHFVHYLLTPILGVYPSPGHRLMTYLLHHLFPLNYTVARLFILAVLAGTTIMLGQIVRTFARSDQWWTVALLAPFAFSLTLLSPVWWWSNGLPVLPGLLFTAIALHAWLNSYTGTKDTFWILITAFAIAAAGAFYIKFLLIPLYLLLIRLVILPRLIELPGGLARLWNERLRWVAIATPPAVFLAVFVLSGLAGASVQSGERPILAFFAAAWFHALVPVSFLNAPLDPVTRFSASAWVIVISSHLLLVGLIAATWRRSTLAIRAWVLFIVVFAANITMVGAARLASFEIDDIAYALRYYPDIVFFLPITLALGLRKGAERGARVAWEETTVGRTGLALFACVFVVSFIAWAPGLVRTSEGAQARMWFDNLNRDIRSLEKDGPVRLVDSDTPEYVMPQWLGPDNRASVILSLASVDVVTNEVAEPMHLVQDDGRLAEAAFHPTAMVLSRSTLGEGVHVEGEDETNSTAGTCVVEDAALSFRPEAEISGERMAVEVSYAGESLHPAQLEVESADPDGGVRRLELRPDDRDAELLDIGTSRLRALRLIPSGGDVVCIDRMDIGSLRGIRPDVGSAHEAG